VSEKADHNRIFTQPIQGQFPVKCFAHVASMIFISTCYLLSQDYDSFLIIRNRISI